MPPRQRPVRVLWVEGKDDSAVTQSLCAQHDLARIFDVEAKTGVDELLDKFYLGLRAPGAERFGLVVDANGDPGARWDAIRHRLQDEGYAHVPDTLQPDGIVVPATKHRPTFGVWIMPDNGSPGMLEDFARGLIAADDSLWPRAVDAVDSIPEQDRRFSAAHRSKAVIHTWLAWQEGPGSPMGQAITKGDLDAHAPLAQRFVAWLRRLMTDEEPAPAA